MRRSKFTPEPILQAMRQAMRQAEAGTVVGEICRKMGVTEATGRIIRSLSGVVFMLLSARAGAQGSIVGTAYDSLSTRGPLANATVVLVERARYATADARGRFRIDSVPDGHYTIGCLHPVLDSLDL
ncbi:MAG: hypothetical protein HY084_07965 [Gemmatimonadetes bacterium]|nr:hypothetical protein [Gemmatimonadota bacterium]